MELGCLMKPVQRKSRMKVGQGEITHISLHAIEVVD
jgi:hypothetical protein